MKGLAISSLVLGIIGILFCWIVIGIIPAILALIFGFIACFNRNARGMAIAGLVLGIIGTIVSATIMYIAHHPEMLLEEMVKMKPKIEKETKRLEEQMQSVMRKIELQEEDQEVTIDYVLLSLVAMEMAKEVKLKQPEALWGDNLYKLTFKTPHLSERELSPAKGKYALILMVKVNNPENKYVFSKNGYIEDFKGKKYYSSLNAVKAEKQEEWHPTIFIEKIGWLPFALQEVITEGLVAPGESFYWIFIFHLPKERKAKEFLFEYTVSETADLSIGEKWKGKSHLTLIQ